MADPHKVRVGQWIAGAFVGGLLVGGLVGTPLQEAGAPGTQSCAPAQILTQQAFSPEQGATPLVITTIDAAQQSVHMAAYSFTSRPIAEALVRARRRGVDVRVVMDSDAARQSVAEMLSANGVPVRFNSRYAIMHHKFMVIDGRILETGSFNFTRAAERRNAENVLVLHDVPAIAQAYERQWAKLWEEGQPSPAKRERGERP